MSVPFQVSVVQGSFILPLQVGDAPDALCWING